MAVEHARVTVGATATLLSTTVVQDTGLPVVRHTTSVQNPTGSGKTVYLGGAGVTSTDYGFALAEGSDWTTDLQPGEAMYGVVASATATVNVLRVGV